ncbi:histidine kinase dimerization/phospho-acceptor domain-containing protein [Ramlibacter sp. H39-3-26]|uniref:sensor histidine kinase n=1 Tax=Curvibacter soli TaxID=3031331 RepID=UPI0023DBBE6D|nr:histidine kinase dimerization/phospho-acceptor domain-containing protein [Ramlibacter sp. H39-3-26]MDF1484609.1 histidine kinase dimerization/phospho-acceptor domain-containing protein [Ramlibacter sp. H39-3-26]
MKGIGGQPTLTRHLLLWALGALLVVWGGFVFLGFRAGVHEADELTDGHLAGVAALLLNLDAAQFIAPDQATQRVDLPRLRSHDYQQSFSAFVWDAQGRLLGRIGGAPAPAFADETGFADLRLGPQGDGWRAFSQWGVGRDRKVMVLVSLEERDGLANDIAEQLVEPGLWLLPVVALALGLAIQRGLRPLYALSQDAARLDVARAQRLPARSPLREFDAVVASINALLDRQQAALARERSLANEVAHELRTPLSSIALQARALAGPMEEAERAQATARIGQDALRAGHVLGQLLALARTSRAELHDAAAPVDLAALAREVCGGYAQDAWARHDSLAVEGPEALALQGHALLLEMALRNLVENALKHTPPGTRIEVRLGLAGAAPWLQVSDDGLRAAASLAARTPDSLRLGHQIVTRVAEAHGARFGAAAAAPPFTTCYRMAFDAGRA